MPTLVDGSNLLHALPPGLRSREEVRRLALELVRRRGGRVQLVFDGPPPAGAPEREPLGRLTVVYSNERTADDLIVAALPRRATAWVVVTDDAELRRRARQMGAKVRPVADWKRRLLAADAPRDQVEKPDRELSPNEVAAWERFFAGDDTTDP